MLHASSHVTNLINTFGAPLGSITLRFRRNTLNQLISAALDNRWHTLEVGLELTTPDNTSGSPFSIGLINHDMVEILTNGGTSIEINRQAFISALEYLACNQHLENNPCRIGSNKDIQQAGPLCVAVRNANGVNVMIINYLLSLLSRMNLVEINGNRPNTTWLL